MFTLFSEKELLRMVREVSEDRIYDTIEFNEFLQMMSKQMRNYSQDSLRDAFRYSSNKIRKTENDLLIIVCQNLIGL